MIKILSLPEITAEDLDLLWDSLGDDDPEILKESLSSGTSQMARWEMDGSRAVMVIYPRADYLFVWYMGGENLNRHYTSLVDAISEVAREMNLKGVEAKATARLGQFYKAKLGFEITHYFVRKEI